MQLTGFISVHYGAFLIYILFYNQHSWINKINIQEIVSIFNYNSL